MGCKHKHKIYETRLRSFLKALNGRVLEVLVDAAILRVLGIPFLEGIGVSILIEAACFGISYGIERLWNKISWGRRIL